jgi:hypothetical protein
MTVEELLMGVLTPKEMVLFINNMDIPSGLYNEYENDGGDVVISQFILSKTNEGHKYWYDIHLREPMLKYNTPKHKFI